MPGKPNILEIRYIAVQYSEDVFIYLYRCRASDLRLRFRNVRGDSDTKMAVGTSGQHEQLVT